MKKLPRTHIVRSDLKGSRGDFYKKSPEQSGLCSGVEVPPRFELGVELLQSSALPLGYGTVRTKGDPGLEGDMLL